MTARYPVAAFALMGWTPAREAAHRAELAAAHAAYDASPEAAEALEECRAIRAARVAQIEADVRKDAAQRRREAAAEITTIRSSTTGRSFSFRQRVAFDPCETPHLERLMSTGGL